MKTAARMSFAPHRSDRVRTRALLRASRMAVLHPKGYRAEMAKTGFVRIARSISQYPANHPTGAVAPAGKTG